AGRDGAGAGALSRRLRVYRPLPPDAGRGGGHPLAAAERGGPDVCRLPRLQGGTGRERGRPGGDDGGRERLDHPLPGRQEGGPAAAAPPRALHPHQGGATRRRGTLGDALRD
ncbi:MAG: hypothetical protein AVDCRST_MAG88-331, partial [uncultured Thermomicrobiales bacterium]